MTSLTLAAVVMTLSGVPSPPQIKWCLLPVLRRSTGDGPVSALLFRADMEAVHACPRPVELAGRVQLGEQDPVQLVEDSYLLPPVQLAPARLPRAEAQLLGQESPGYVVVEHEQDALPTEPARHRPRTRRPLRPRRQERLDQRPQVVVHDPRPSTHTITNGQIVTPVTANQHTSTGSCYELIYGLTHAPSERAVFGGGPGWFSARCRSLPGPN